MSDSNLYSRLLLSKGHGYPLFGPQPFDDLPIESRRLGTQIGDVGVVTADGSFDVIFNICRSADDPLNRFGVPEGFEQVRIGPGDIASRPQYHRPGSDVSNTRISKRRLDVDTGVESNVFLPLGAGAVVEISTSSKEAAVLLLPDGASRTDLRCMKNRFRDYAFKHAHRWYAFVNGTLGMMVESGDLYLVTGMDKSTSWSVAAIEDHSEDCRISLKLKAAQIGSAGTSCAWEWETTSSFANSGPRRQPGEEEWTDNQTVFIRGFKVTVRSRPSPLQKSVKVPAIVGSKPSEILTRSGYVPYSQSPSSSGASFSRNTSSSSSGGASDDEDSVVYFPDIAPPYHPATRINEHLLDLFPAIDVAVTHDDEWVAVLNEGDTEMPSDSELMERIDRKYSVAASANGVWLGEPSQDADVPSNSHPPGSLIAEVEDCEPPPKHHTPKRKQSKQHRDAPLWPDRVETLLIAGLREYQDAPRATLSTRDYIRGRYQFLVNYLEKLGITRSKKQLASHLQALRVRWEGKPEYRLVAGGDELFAFEFGNQVEDSTSLEGRSEPSISSRQLRQTAGKMSREKSDYSGLVQRVKGAKELHIHSPISYDKDDKPPGSLDSKVSQESESARVPHSDRTVATNLVPYGLQRTRLVPCRPSGSKPQKALIMGISYDKPERNPLHADVKQMRKMLTEQYGYAEGDIVTLLDSPPGTVLEPSATRRGYNGKGQSVDQWLPPGSIDDRRNNCTEDQDASATLRTGTRQPATVGTPQANDVTRKARGSGTTSWPVHLEAALLEGLQSNMPDRPRRFPGRNKFISDRILKDTGHHRTPKQVGSRLQQLRELSIQPGARDYSTHFLAPPLDSAGQTGDKPGPLQHLDVIRQSLAGLEYLHSQDTVHGDLRGVNILVDKGQGRACLADFGLSALADTSQMSAKQASSIRWMAPEIVDPRSETTQGTSVKGRGVASASFWELPSPESVWKLLKSREPVVWLSGPAGTGKSTIAQKFSTADPLQSPHLTAFQQMEKSLVESRAGNVRAMQDLLNSDEDDAPSNEPSMAGMFGYTGTEPVKKPRGRGQPDASLGILLSDPGPSLALNPLSATSLEQIPWLHGPAGTGKSAIAHLLRPHLELFQQLEKETIEIHC